MTETTTTPDELARTYLDAWQRGEIDRIRPLLADDVTFRGPLGTADGVEECLEGLRGLARIIERIDVARMLTEGDDVITWYDLVTTEADPVPTVNWSHVRDGRIDRIRVVFDPRPLLG